MSAEPSLFQLQEDSSEPRKWRIGDEAVWRWLYVTLIEPAGEGRWRVAGPALTGGVQEVAEAELQPRPAKRTKLPIDAPPIDDVQPMPDVDADLMPLTPFRALPVSRDAEEAPLMVVDATSAPKTQPVPHSAAQSKRRGAR